MAESIKEGSTTGHATCGQKKFYTMDLHESTVCILITGLGIAKYAAEFHSDP